MEIKCGKELELYFNIWKLSCAFTLNRATSATRRLGSTGAMDLSELDEARGRWVSDPWQEKIREARSTADRHKKSMRDERLFLMLNM